MLQECLDRGCIVFDFSEGKLEFVGILLLTLLVLYLIYPIPPPFLEDFEEGRLGVWL